MVKSTSDGGQSTAREHGEREKLHRQKVEQGKAFQLQR